MATESGSVKSLIGVYDADHTVWGEASYWIGARFGRRHCALCDITHGLFRERADWREQRDELPVRFETFHRDDQPAEVRAAAAGVAPVVVAHTESGYRVVLGPDEIEACGGSPERLVAAIDEALGPETP